MPALVIRIYETQTAATKAVNELKKQKFEADEIQVVRPGATSSDTVHALHAAGIQPAHAKHYAEALTGERALVVVNPPFGHGSLAESIVDQFKPVETDISARLDEAGDFTSDATPFSRYFGWRVLLKNPTPLSSWFGWRTLADKQRPSAEIKLSHDATPFSNALGFKTLSDDPTPLSSRFGWRLLGSNPAPFSTRMGWDTLSPKKYTLGEVKLSDDPTPFSRLFGLTVLSEKQ
jgi:hypothetical protein